MLNKYNLCCSSSLPPTFLFSFRVLSTAEGLFSFSTALQLNLTVVVWSCLRGRRNKKQTLRMPISLLKKPYSSQSFKVVYSRVIRTKPQVPKLASLGSDDIAEENAT